MFRQNAYYPYRAVKDRPYFKDFGDLPRGKRSWEGLVQSALFGAMSCFGPRGETRDDPVAHLCGMNEAKLSDMLAHFFMDGQAVFHIAQPLRDAFLNSDLGEATPGDLRLPFRTFYVHLGTDLEMTFNEGATVLEGALLQGDPREQGLSVALVGRLLEDPPHWGFRGLESFNFYLSKEDVDAPLMHAITNRLERLGRDPKDVRDLNRWSDFTEETRADIERTWESHSRERLLYMQNMTVTLQAMKLVANALLYLSQYPEDSEPAWQEGTPRGYIEKYARQTDDPKARAKTLSRAQHEGFTVIRKVGKLFEQEEAKGQGESPSPHLRRAHWRRQAYGPKLSLRKLMWIRAVRVLGGTQRERPYLMADAELQAD